MSVYWTWLLPMYEVYADLRILTFSGSVIIIPFTDIVGIVRKPVEQDTRFSNCQRYRLKEYVVVRYAYPVRFEDSASNNNKTGICIPDKIYRRPLHFRMIIHESSLVSDPGLCEPVQLFRFE
jgi:hypothetical protein